MTGHVNYYRAFSTEMSERPYRRTIVIAVDASAHSEQAFDWYMKSIHRPMNRILLVHCPEVDDVGFEDLKEMASEMNSANESTGSIRDKDVHIADQVSQLGDSLTLPLEQVREILENGELQANEMIEKYQKKLEKANANTIYRIVLGKPCEVILDEAKRENASLIVMATRGMNLSRRTIIGTVSDYVVRHSNIPVIVYRN